MRFLLRFTATLLLLGCAQVAFAQASGPKVDRVDIKYIGPTNVSEQFIRSNIRLKAGNSYSPTLTEADIHALYATGQFTDIHVAVDPAADGGLMVTYIVQSNLRITDVKIEGNKNVSASKIKKIITVKTGEPMDEQKLFSDTQEIKKLYEKYGYPDTQVKYVLNIDENAGRSSVTFEIVESPKIIITQIEFIGAAAFSQKELYKQIKTSRRRWYSW